VKTEISEAPVIMAEPHRIEPLDDWTTFCLTKGKGKTKISSIAFRISEDKSEIKNVKNSNYFTGGMNP
jgi:hypothetical protein